MRCFRRARSADGHGSRHRAAAVPRRRAGRGGRRALLDNVTMRARSLGYQTDLAVRVAQGSTVTDCGDHLIVRTEQNPRYWWGNFLLLAAAPSGSEMPGWLERFAAVFPAARHRVFGVDVADAAEVDDAVFASAGLTADRGVVLTAVAVRPPPRRH